MTVDQYLSNILRRETVNTNTTSPLFQLQTLIKPTVENWAGNLLKGLHPSGSFAKGTANKNGTDIDLFISLSSDTKENLREIFNSLYSVLKSSNYSPRKQNVSLGITLNGYDVDIIPAKRQSQYGNDHSLYRSKADTWTKTNISNHISYVKNSNRTAEIRLLKLWRNQKGFDFPSFYLELAVIAALYNAPYFNLGNNLLKIFRYLANSFVNDRYTDPSNSNNIISDDLSTTEKEKVAIEAQKALSARTWNDIVV